MASAASSQSSGNRRGTVPPPRGNMPAPATPRPEPSANPTQNTSFTRRTPSGDPLSDSAQNTQSNTANRARFQAKRLENFIGGQQASSREVEAANDNDYQPSVLDAANQQPFFSPSSDEAENDNTDESPADATKARNQAFMNEQRADQSRQEQFISPNASTPDQQTDPASRSRSPRSNSSQQVAGNSTYNTTNQRINSLYAGVNAAAREEQDQKEREQLQADELAAQSSGGGSSPLTEMAGRSTRVALGATGCLTPVAMIWIYSKIIRNFFKKGPDKVPPTEAMRDVSEAATITLEATVGVFMLFLESLPLILPIVITVVGVMLATQYLGPDIAALVVQLAN